MKETTKIYEPKIDDYVKPDDWYSGHCLEGSDGFSDSGFPGCQFRLPCDSYEVGGTGPLAVNIKVTGRSWRLYKGELAVRVKIEFVGDCEPSTFASGWLWPAGQNLI
jgi:hypothetical protein